MSLDDAPVGMAEEAFEFIRTSHLEGPSQGQCNVASVEVCTVQSMLGRPQEKALPV